MQYYHFLSKLKFLNKYSYKFLFISFIGIHIPLIGLILYIVLGPDYELYPLAIIGITLLLTLVATGITLYFLHLLIAPIRVLQSALHDYLTKQKLPDLPTHYQDEVGVLMHDVQHAIIGINYLMEEKKDLLAVLSHDMRTPIHNIQQASGLLRKEENPEIKERLLDIIDQATVQQLDLIQNIVNLWRHESTNVQLYELEPVQINRVVTAVLKQQELAMLEKHLKVQAEIPEDHQIYAEPNIIGEVISNLLVNAIKFSMPEGLIRIWSEKKGEYVKVFIQDQGLGFKPEQTEGLFQRFTPLRRRGTKGEGTIGIGLYICRKLLQKQDASIAAFSAGEGQGATFTLEFKAVTMPAVQDVK